MEAPHDEHRQRDEREQRHADERQRTQHRVEVLAHPSLRYLALQQLLDGQLVAQLVAVGRDIHAPQRQRLAEFLRAQLVALRHGFEGPVHVGFADADAALGSELQLQALQHHAFEQLFPQRCVRRRADFFQLQLFPGLAQALLELALRDDVVVDDHHDAVDVADALRRGRRGVGGQRRHQARQRQAERGGFEESMHDFVSGFSVDSAQAPEFKRR